MAGNIVEFVLKARDEATKEIRKVSGEFGGLSSTLERITGGAGLFGMLAVGTTLAGGAAIAAAKSYADLAETLDRQARSGGMTTAQMQSLRASFEAAGLSGDDAATGIHKLLIAIQDGDPALKALNVTSRDGYVAFQQLGKGLAAITDPAERAKLVQDTLGKGLAESAGIIIDLAAATDEAATVYKRFGAAMDDEATPAALALDSAFDGLQLRTGAVALSLEKHLTPSLVGGLEAINKMLDGIADLTKALAKLDHGLAARQTASVESFLRKMHPELFPGAVTYGGGGSGGHGGGVDWTAEEVTVTTKKKPEKKTPKREYQLGPGYYAGMFGPYNDSATMAAYSESTTKSPVKSFNDDLQALIPVIKQLDGAHAALVAEMQRSAMQLRSNISGDISGSVMDVIRGTNQIGDAFSQLTKRILDDVISQGVDFGISTLFSLIPIPGAGAVGSAIGKAGSKSMSAPVSVGGGNTYVIQSIDAKSVLQSLVAPSGSMRRANDRLRDIAAAS